MCARTIQGDFGKNGRTMCAPTPILPKRGTHMDALFDNLPFKPADILLPQDCDYDKWAVVACDQYTSQPF